MYADVIVDTDAPGLSQPFTYRVPDELLGDVFEGACVAVPFGGREKIGYVLSLTETLPTIDEVKDIRAMIFDTCVLNPPLPNLARWMSEYYIAPLAHSVRAIIPEVMSATISSTVRLIDPELVSQASPNQKKLVATLTSMGGEVDSDTLKAASRMDGFSAALRQLKKRGAVEVARVLELPKARPLIARGLEMVDDNESADAGEIPSRAPKQAAIVKELAQSSDPVRQSELLRRVGSSSSPVKALVDKGLVKKVDLRIRRKPFQGLPGDTRDNLVPTQAQDNALRMVREGLSSGVPNTILLHGVTASGKTEVYLRSIAEALDQGKSCIALVPEISLTTHLMHAYVSRFGDDIAILHSRLSTGERHDEWRRIESGEARVVLGARLAVFAPVRNLGLIVVDEEHEPSYKQDHSPRYNARLVAEERSRMENASLILGSATPAMETYYRAASGDIGIAALDERIDNRPLPVVSSVDLREEFQQGRRSFFSERLQEAVAERLSRNEQVILFVNRRGYASFLLCRTCGHTPKCGNCDISLTYHSAAKLLRCHHCNDAHPAPTVCPECGGPHIKQFGVGTERVEEQARQVFPEASVIRMDSDTTRRKGSHAALLNEFREGKANILVGTQMIAKGLDFPNVTLVGVISADTSLHLPDFRAGERTFQLLTQVSGRAGRGESPGEVIVQSFCPDHYAIEAASRHDYSGFYEQEIEFRRELRYPPFSRLINIVSSDPVDGYAESRLNELLRALDGRIPRQAVDILGPAPAPFSRLKGLYRWHLLLRNHGDFDLTPILKESIEKMPAGLKTDLTIDVDPQSML